MSIFKLVVLLAQRAICRWHFRQWALELFQGLSACQQHSTQATLAGSYETSVYCGHNLSSQLVPGTYACRSALLCQPESSQSHLKTTHRHYYQTSPTYCSHPKPETIPKEMLMHLDCLP